MTGNPAEQNQPQQEGGPNAGSAARRPKMRIHSVLALLENPAFCDEAGQLLQEIAAFAATAPCDRQQVASVLEKTTPFVEKWGVPPPQAGALVNPTPARALADAIMSGRWGVLPIFAWTTNQEIRIGLQRIRRMVRKQHQNAETARRAQLARWLESCNLGFSRPAIAGAVWGRRRGLRRPSRAQAIAQLPEKVERAWYQAYLAQGRSPQQAERLTTKRARGSEAPASATVRMAEHRYEQDLERLNATLASPVSSEPVSAALTMLYRADRQDVAQLVRGLVALKNALLQPRTS
jgi:hypothetical protein